MCDQPEEKRLTVTVEEAAKILGIGRNTAYSAIKSGELPSIKLRGRIVVPRHALSKLMGAEPQEVTTRDEVAALRGNLTREFKHTVIERIKSDPDFAAELFKAMLHWMNKGGEK